MDWRVLVADSLKAMAVNSSAEIVPNGVKISNEDKCNATWNDPDWCKYWGVDYACDDEE